MGVEGGRGLQGRLVGSATRCQTSGRGSNRSWPGSRSPLATSGWSGAACGRSTGPTSASWLLVYPDTYEIGLPNQGLQILYEILNERDDAVAERAYAPWLDMRREMRRAPGAALLGRHPPRRRRLRRRSPSTSRPSSSTRTCSNCLDLAGVPVRAEDRRPEHPLVIAGGHCAFNPEPHGRLRRRVRDRRRRGGGRRDHRGRRRVEARRAGPAPRRRAARARHDPRRLRARRCTTSSTTAPSIARGHARATPTCPTVVDKRTVADLADWPYPKKQLVPLIEVVHDRLNVEIFRGCTRGCRFCQAGMITRPVRERPEDQVRTMVRGRPAPHRLRRGRAHVAVERRLLRDRRRSSPTS